MKRLFLLLSLLFCGFAYADTINLHWLNYDGTSYQDSTCVVDSDLILPSTPPTRYGYTFTGWKLVNYIPIEYLESTGTQWIDTGFYPNQDTRIRTKIMLTSINDREAQWFGSGDYHDTFAWSHQLYFRINKQYKILDTLNVGDTIECDINRNYITYSINGQSKNPVSLAIQQFVSPNSMWVFNDNYPGYTYTAKLKLYYFQIYDNDTLVRDFIPVLDENAVPCMFDKVTQQFFYNQGTGNFIAGPVLQ